jgi:predicted transposase/invertase (TIGR01784 family)
MLAVDDFLDFSTTPNDAYFKAAFGDPQRAALFFQSHLEQALVRRVDWSSLRLVSGSYVEKSLAQSESDLVFSASMDGQQVLFYLLFEHQSTVDTYMPLRLLGYIYRLLSKYQEEHGLPLPVVLPFVLHQGPEKWNVSTQFQDLFGLTQDQLDLLGPYIPKFQHALLDLTEEDPANEEYHDQLRLVLQLMKQARIRKIGEFLSWLKEELTNGHRDLPEGLLLLSFVYLVHVDDQVDRKTIAATLAAYPDIKDSVMTYAQKLTAEGEAIGEARGEARGKAMGEAHGKVKGKIEVLEQLMGEVQTSSEVLDAMTLEQLQQHFVELERQYRLRFK